VPRPADGASLAPVGEAAPHPAAHPAGRSSQGLDAPGSTAPAVGGTDPAAAALPAAGAVVVPAQPAPVVPAGPALAAAPAPPVPVQHQVFAAVVPLLRGDDGSYGVQLQLHPHDLGAVQVTVDVRHGEISVQLHAADPAAQDALRDGLSDLRRQLEDQGLRTGSLEVGSGGADPRQRGSGRPQTLELPGRAVGVIPYGAPPSATATATTTALDLRM
jgi:flagellar hook-length control protein FliK